MHSQGEFSNVLNLLKGEINKIRQKHILEAL